MNLSPDDSIEEAIERYRMAIPDALRLLSIWLVWRFEPASEPGKKPLKVPYYAGSGKRRAGVQGSAEDIAQLVTFEAAIDAFRTGKWTGLGIAHVPGCGLNSWDFDNCIGPDGIDQAVHALVHASGTYVEVSPSGNGLRMVALGTLPSIKRIHPDGYNIECFGESGFVTITARVICGDTISEVPATVLAQLRAWLQSDDKVETHSRTAQIDQVRANDATYLHIKAAGAIKHDWPDGRSSIVCPFEGTHTGGSGNSDTVYFLPQTFGYATGHFKCLHAHCAQRTDAEFEAALGVQQIDISGLLPKVASGPYVRAPIDWVDLARNPPAPREWALDGWLGIGFMTLFAGRGGVGKTLILQQAFSALSLAKQFLVPIEQPRRCLLWAAEDDADELKRRQLAIADWLNVPVGMFADQLIIEPLAGVDCSLVVLHNGNLVLTKMAKVLWEQINDYKVEVFGLDNIAHLYGGNENDRHQVTQFTSTLTGMCMSARAAGVLAGHPAKGTESEFSGSTAWENAMRGRLYLSRTPPDEDEKKPDPESTVRYLSKRKANYSALDSRRLNYANGVLVPEEASGAADDFIRGISSNRARKVVIEAVETLAKSGVYGSPSSQGGNFLPKLIANYKLSQGQHRSELERAMRQLMVEGKLVVEVVGKYDNRRAKEGLVLK